MGAELHFELCCWDNNRHTRAFLDLLNHYMADPMGNFPPLDNSGQEKLLADLSAHPTAEVLLMSLNGQYIGMSTFFVNYSTFLLKPYIYIHDVVVHKAQRNQGYGKLMIRELIRLARERNYCKLTLEVRKDNPAAQKVYSNLGFEAGNPEMLFWSKRL
ncbi:MAG: GNAT family N-acetyltransferase [Bacteroidales bacterium]|nr:GNAT family N-acetyltransferase [Bacteroidales bacterium]MDD4362488.1 GNAT family N-acetyltransferase [Bacteroidales bacterium]MDD4431000.1 GNAT family N-acetyltransferase [Bacteroidales bacterium]